MKKILLMILVAHVSSSWALSVAPPYEGLMYTYDKNKDGKLSLKEFLAIQPPTESSVLSFSISRESFRQLDINRNGYLETQEIAGRVGFSEEMNCYITYWPRSEEEGFCEKMLSERKMTTPSSGS